jgi:hypothetical protein
MNHIHQQIEFGEDWFSYPTLYSNATKRFPSGSKFVEVGSWKGKSSAYMAVEIANSNKDIEFFCVDTWEGSVEHEGMEELTKLYDIFLSNMKPLEQYYFPLKISSLDAAKKFKDESLDFVFIDASHEYEDVKEDIKAWLPKVKPGGILAGHDYYVEGTDWFPGVKQAVHETLNDFDCSENCWIHYKEDSSKLKNFPPLHFISIEESVDRRNSLYNQFKKYNITNITPHIYKKYSDEDHVITGKDSESLIGSGRGPLTSHLKTVKDWYYNTDEEYAFFCEDDLSLENVKYWNFTWQEFFLSLPSDWECVQLSWVREEFFYFSVEELKLRNRCWCDWSGCAYLISRKHAEKLIANYYSDNSFRLEYRGWDRDLRDESFRRPTIETIIFSAFGPVYGFPLFSEDVINFESTWAYGHPQWNLLSYNEISNWWKTIGNTLKIEDIAN